MFRAESRTLVWGAYSYTNQFMPRTPPNFASIRTRLHCLVLLAILPGLGLALLAYMKELQLRKTYVREQALLLMRVVTSHQEQLITDARQLLAVLAQLPQVRSSDSRACNSLMGSLIKQYPLYASIGAIKPNGEVFCSSPPNTNANFTNQPWLHSTLRSQQFKVSDYQIGRISDKPVIVFAHPVTRDAQVQSVVFAALDLAWLNQLIAKVKLPPFASLVVVDANGTILAHYPDSAKWVGKTFPNLPVVETILAQGKGIAEINDVDGMARLYAFTLLNDLPAANVYMGIGLSKTDPFAEAEQNLRRNLVALLAVTTIALALLWLGGDRFILDWVQQFTDVIDRYASGDLNARVGFENVPREMQQLANTFDRMATSLANHINRSQLAEAELKRANERFQLAVAAVNALIYDWDILNKTIVRTQGLYDVLGYRTTEAVPTDDWWYSIIHPDDVKVVRNQVAAALKNTNCDFSLEYRVRSKDNHYLYVWDKGIIVRDAQGNAERVVGSILNITERKQAEAAIHQLNTTLESQVQQRTAQLAATNHELESFSYSVSHDLRAPLRHVMGFAEALAQRLEHTSAMTDPKVQRYIDVIQNSSARMMLLIDGLLTLSRIGRKQLAHQRVDLNSLVASAISTTQDEYAQQFTEFKIGNLPTVMGDPTLLQQVFINLIDNALKFSQNSNPAVIQIDCLADQTVFIKDNGVGFDMTYADQLFGAFQRLHSQREFKGTGIGLAIVQRIIHRHNGKIWVESAPNQGTTFYFKLGYVSEE